jgi:FdhD protein
MASIPVELLSLARSGTATAKTRAIATETPIAIEVNGIGYAVMMGTPADLQDFATGFALSERLIERAGDILALDAATTDQGIILRLTLGPQAAATILERARQRVSESSCGLCGLENLEAIQRPLPPITDPPPANREAIFAALEGLDAHQPLSRETGAVHGAAFCAGDGHILLAREDVGRHNALDKLIGALARAGSDPATGFFLLTARCSYELVEKTILARCPMLVTISAPTSMAVDRAKAHGLTLVSLARQDSVLVINDPFGRLG